MKQKLPDLVKIEKLLFVKSESRKQKIYISVATNMGNLA